MLYKLNWTLQKDHIVQAHWLPTSVKYSLEQLNVAMYVCTYDREELHECVSYKRDPTPVCALLLLLAVY